MQTALDFNAQNPLFLSPEEVSEIDDKNKAYELKQMQQRYDSVSSVPFKDIPAQAQTVIMSLARQFGGGFTGEIWPMFTKQNWMAAVNDLKTNFGPNYKPRRNAEANFLSQVM